MRPTVAIIGAGIAGLSAAYHLARAGFEPVIFEKESFLGGRMSSEYVDGFIIEKAAYTFPEFHRNLTTFLDELGMRQALVKTPGTSSTFAQGKEHQIKIGSPTDFLKYKLLSLKNKKDMITMFLYAQSLGSALDLTNPTEKTFALEQESAAEYILKNYDEQLLEYIAYPIFCEIFLGTPEGNSKASFLATLKNLTRFKIFSFNKGMGMLPERLAAEMDVRLNTPVLKICGGPRKGPYEVHVGGDNPQSMIFDAVICAVPCPLVPRIVEGLSPELKEHFEGVEYAPSIVIACALDHVYPDTTMINNLCRDHFSVVGTLVFDHHKGPGRVPPGKGLATAILCEQASRALLHEAEDKIVQSALREIDTVVPTFSDKLLFTRVYRWEHGAVQFPTGTISRKLTARSALEENFEDMYFAGDGLYKASLEQSFNSGKMAANNVIGIANAQSKK